MTSQLNCHKCKYNGKCSDECLKCTKAEQTLKYRQYIFDTYDAPQPQTNFCEEQCTSLDEDVEDKMRKFLYDIFDLPENELLMLKAIVNGKSLTEFASDMEKLSKKNKTFSRFKAFQTRKQLLDKLGLEFKHALTTVGQRKELKI